METGKEVNYAEMVNPNTQIILIGESNHNKHSLRFELIKALREYKKMGFSYLGMEMIPSNLTGASLSTLSQHFHEWWGQAGDALLEVVEFAQNSGMKVVGLDKPYEKWIDERLSDEHNIRNRYMVDQITKITDQGEKIVAFTHYAHLYQEGNDQSMKKIIANARLSFIMIKITGGCIRDRCSPFTQMENAAKNAGVNKSRFYIRTPSIHRNSFVVHVPQVPVP